MIYFDNAATTKPYQEVIDTYLKYESTNFYNPSAIYKLGRNGAFLINKIKENILKLLNLQNKKIIFTSSSTEANNLAIMGFLEKKKNRNFNIITSEIEHKSVLNVFKYLEKNGFEVRYVKFKDNQQIDIEDLRSKIDNRTIFASIMAVNNELGTILNIDEVYQVLKEKNIVFHSDFAQALFKADLKLANNCNMMTISSHKIHGLKSIAALIIDSNMELSPIEFGGGQEYGIRPSTMDLPLIASFYKTLELAKANEKRIKSKVKELYDYLLLKLKELDFVEINSNPDFTTHFILNFSLKDAKSSVVVEALSEREIYVSSTSACNSKGEVSSYVIEKLFNDSNRAKNSIRVSFSEENITEEIDIFIKNLIEVYESKMWKV